MISVRHTKKRKDKKVQGLTLPELLIAGLISLITAYVAGDALLSHLRGAERAESLEQQRENWARAAAFIEADIALSERIFDLQTNPSALTIPSACRSYIDPDAPEEQLRLGLEQNNSFDRLACWTLAYWKNDISSMGTLTSELIESNHEIDNLEYSDSWLAERIFFTESNQFEKIRQLLEIPKLYQFSMWNF